MIKEIAKRTSRLKVKHNIDYKECSKCPQCEISKTSLYCGYIDDIVSDDNYDCPARGNLEYISYRFADKLQEKTKYQIQCVELAKGSEYIIKTRVQIWGIPKVFDLNIHITNYNKSGYVKNLNTVVNETVSLLNSKEREILEKYTQEWNEELKDNKLSNGGSR